MSDSTSAVAAVPGFVQQARQMCERASAGDSWVSRVAELVGVSSDHDLGTMAMACAALSTLHPSELEMGEVAGQDATRIEQEGTPLATGEPAVDDVMAARADSGDEMRVTARRFAALAGSVEGALAGLFAFAGYPDAVFLVALSAGVGCLPAAIASSVLRRFSPVGRPYSIGEFVAKCIFVSAITLSFFITFIRGVSG